MAHLLLGCVFTRSILQEVMSEARALVCLPRHSEDLSTPLAVNRSKLSVPFFSLPLTDLEAS